MIKACQAKLNGIAKYNCSEKNLDLTVEYAHGKVKILGKFQENLSIENVLEFEFYSDQSYIQNTENQLEQIVCKYGGNKGVLKK